MRIRGVDDLLVRFAKCCSPVPGRRHRGLHHARPRPDRARARLPHGGQERARQGASRRRGVGRRASRPSGRSRSPSTSGGTGRACSPRSPRAISSRQGNIIKAEITVTDDRKGINHFVMEVEDLRQLQGIMQAIRDVKDIVNVERVRGSVPQSLTAGSSRPSSNGPCAGCPAQFKRQDRQHRRRGRGLGGRRDPRRAGHRAARYPLRALPRDRI